MGFDVTVFVPEKATTVQREIDVPADVSEGLETVYSMWTEDNARIGTVPFKTPEQLKTFIKQANYWAYNRPLGRVKFQRVSNPLNSDTVICFRVRSLPTTLEIAQNAVYNARATLRTAKNAGIAADITAAEAKVTAAEFNLKALKDAG
jgi:hypothetical protein